MIIHGNEVKEKLLQGIDIVANTVKPTLGPQARTVILQGNPPVIINDGITITKYISHKDPYVQMGIQMVQNLANQAQTESGDGTTTACVLAQALCHSMLEAEIKDIHSFNELLNQLKNQVIEHIDEVKFPVQEEDVVRVASIAANNDTELGMLIGDAVNMVGKSGIITVEESNSYKTELVLREGMEIPEGYLSHLMCNTDAGKVRYKDPLIFLSNIPFRNFKDIVPMLEYASTQSRPLLILCKGMEGSAMNNLLMNILNQTVQCSVILAPNFGDAQIDELGDIQSLVGGKVFNHESKDDPTVFIDEYFGTCEEVIISKEKTIFVGGKGDTTSKIETLSLMVDDMEGYDKARIKSRIARLKGGVATIKVGASSTLEMREKKERLDDALNATKAALEEGIVIGGGMCLFKATSKIDKKNAWFRNALEAPYRTLLENSGREDVIPNKAFTNMQINNRRFSKKKPNYGFNALTNTHEDLYDAGIFDPAKVCKSSFLAAMSIAQLFFSTDVAVLLPEE